MSKFSHDADDEDDAAGAMTILRRFLRNSRAKMIAIKKLTNTIRLPKNGNVGLRCLGIVILNSSVNF